MSVYVDLPCGCQINEAFVLSMCMEHAMELDAKKLEALQDYHRYEQAVSSAVGKTPVTWTCPSCSMRGRPADAYVCTNCGEKRPENERT